MEFILGVFSLMLVASGSICAAEDIVLCQEAHPKAHSRTQIMQRRSPLMKAALSGNIQRAKEIVREKADKEEEDQFGNTALLLAATRRNNQEMVKLLLDAKANPGHRNKSGDNALHMAINSGASELIEILLWAGVYPFAINEACETPFSSAQKEKEMAAIFDDYLQILAN